jgi:hypothetical protein
MEVLHAIVISVTRLESFSERHTLMRGVDAGFVALRSSLSLSLSTE